MWENEGSPWRTWQLTSARRDEPSTWTEGSKYSLVTGEWALVGGLVASGIAAAVTDVVERSSISGPGRSLSGNGVLSGAAVGAVAVLGGGWAAIAARATWPRRVVVSLAALLTTLLVAAIWEFSLLLPNPFTALGEQTAIPALFATLVGVALPRLVNTGGAVPRSALVAVALLLVATLALPGVIWATFYWIVAPFLVNLPLLVRAGRAGGLGWLVGACIAVIFGSVAGVMAGVSAFGVG